MKRKKGGSRRKKVSSKVLAALARGRKKLAAMRKGRKSKSKSPGRRRRIARRIPEPLESIVIEGGGGMAGKRRKSHRRKARKMSGEFFGRRKRRRSRRMSGEFFGRKKRRCVRRYHGERSKGVIGAVTNAVMIAGGGMAGALAAKYIPVKNAKIKAALPLIMGVGLSMIKIGRKAPFDKLATGMAVIGVLSLVKSFVPSLPTMAGEEEVMYLPSPEEAAMLGLDDDQYENAHADYYGESFEGEGDIEALQAENFATPADM
jgi:hypothetical protein